MFRRAAAVIIFTFIVLSFLFIPISATVSAQQPFIPQVVKVAVCYDPEELLGIFGGGPEYLVELIEDGGGIDAEAVTYEQVVLGALSDNTFFDGGFDVAYFWGGGSIIFQTLLGTGLGDQIKDFVGTRGKGLVAHCGAAAAMSRNLKTLFFIRIPALGIIPVDANVEINQLLNLLGRALVSLGSRFLAPVTVDFASLLTGEREYVWDGGVSYAYWPGSGVKVHARVESFDVNRRFARYNFYRPFFLSSTYGFGKVMWSPGSPEGASEKAVASEILRAEIMYVRP